MKSQFRKAAIMGLVTGTAALAGCDPAGVPVTLTAADGTMVSAKIRPGSTPVTLVEEDGTSISCREEFSERASIATTRRFVICAETERVIRRRQWLDARDAAAGAVAAGNGAGAVTIINN